MLICRITLIKYGDKLQTGYKTPRVFHENYNKISKTDFKIKFKYYLLELCNQIMYNLISKIALKILICTFI